MSLFRSSGDTNQFSRKKVWDDFRSDYKTLAMLRVTPDEVTRLQTVFMLSKFSERSQLLEALSRLRAGWKL